jgi:hypothetical protein
MLGSDGIIRQLNSEIITPLWSQPIPIVGVTGRFGSGKTLFGLTIDPAHTLGYDTEKSSASYEALGFTRVDVPGEMLARFPGGGYKPIDTFTWWLAHVHNIAPHTYRVIMLDTVSEIESGLVEWVRANPQAFGHTSGQYAKMSGLLWGDVKDLWKRILSDIAARCETLVYTSHMTSVWSGERPTGKRKPKGKETLHELASLYLHLEREPDRQGNVPDKPAALVLKSRLAVPRINPETGGVEIVPLLPPRIPVATPAAIRKYMVTPPDYARLAEDERVPETTITEDERAEIRLATAEAERDAETLRLQRLERQQAAVGGVSSADRSVVEYIRREIPETREVSGNLIRDVAETARNSSDGAARISVDKINTINDCRKQLLDVGMPEERWSAILAGYGVTDVGGLTVEQGEHLLTRCINKLAQVSQHKAQAMKGGDVATANTKS